jgi:alpha-tubulin suppressor-like RCC1 family protein
MSNFNSIEGDFDRVFFKEQELYDRFVGLSLWTFGKNQYGEIGNNSTTDSIIPTKVLTKIDNWKTTSCGGNQSAAIKTDGTLWTWGYGVRGVLGNNSTTNRSSPGTIAGGGTDWSIINCGIWHMSAIKIDGTLWLWGNNDVGQLGNNSTVSVSSPVTTSGGGNTWKSTECGTTIAFSSAIKADGTLWLWGDNQHGKLGDNSTNNKSSPVTTSGGGNTWQQSACGGNHTVAIKTDGTLWTWGHGIYGQLGDNSTISKLSPVTTSGGGTNWKQVAAGYWFTAAIKTDGTLWTWGYNDKGQLGDNSIVNKSSPNTTSGGGTIWKQLACSGAAMSSIKTDGTLWSWGDNSYGGLGDNSFVSKSSPITTSIGGTTWKQVARSQTHTIANRNA